MAGADRKKSGAHRKKPAAPAAPSSEDAPPDAGAAPAPAPLAGEPRRPAFARGFPREPALDRLVDLFEQGNYAAVRDGAPSVIAASEDPDVRAAVRELQKRMAPDPISVGLVVTAALLLAILAGWYWSHPHEDAPPRAAPAPGPVSS